MNALTKTHADDTGITFEETSPGRWTVTIDGEDTRSISQEGSCFIAWRGFMDRHWNFERALQACAEDARFHRRYYAERKREYDASVASIMEMTPEQKARAIAQLEERRERLEYSSGSHVDIAAKRAELDRQIESLRAA